MAEFGHHEVVAVGGFSAQDDIATWSGEWRLLLDELSRSRDRVALLVDGSSSTAVTRLEALVEEVLSIGEVFSHLDDPKQLVGAVAPHGSSVLLVDVEVLFSPQLELDVLGFLRRLSHGQALIARWPGGLSSGRLTYSRPGRSDHFDQVARNLVVLRPTDSVFPDEAPFELERYPA